MQNAMKNVSLIDNTSGPFQGQWYKLLKLNHENRVIFHNMDLLSLEISAKFGVVEYEKH